jgi:hypothetical protein
VQPEIWLGLNVAWLSFDDKVNDRALMLSSRLVCEEKRILSSLQDWIYLLFFVFGPEVGK